MDGDGGGAAAARCRRRLAEGTGLLTAHVSAGDLNWALAEIDRLRRAADVAHDALHRLTVGRMDRLDEVIRLEAEVGRLTKACALLKSERDFYWQLAVTRGSAGAAPGVTVHDLKTWPDVFGALWDGTKKAEFRVDDRNYQVGDQLRLNEYDPETDGYSTRTVIADVTHAVRGGRFGMPEGHVMLSLGNTVTWGPSPGGHRLCELLC